jgi:hypothetical protein
MDQDQGNKRSHCFANDLSRLRSWRKGNDCQMPATLAREHRILEMQICRRCRLLQPEGSRCRLCDGGKLVEPRVAAGCDRAKLGILGAFGSVPLAGWLSSHHVAPLAVVACAIGLLSGTAAIADRRWPRSWRPWRARGAVTITGRASALEPDEPTLAASSVFIERSVVMRRDLRAASFVVDTEEGERVLVTGTVWLEPADEAVVVSDGDRVSVVGELRREVTGAAYRDSIHGVIRGEPGRPVVIERLER